MDQTKIGEIRIPTKLLASALAEKKVKQLRLFAIAKLHGHRVGLSHLTRKIAPKTANRIIQYFLDQGWAGSDGEFLFPRSWQRLMLTKRGGLYVTAEPRSLKKFESLCFAFALKQALSRKAGPRPRKGSTRSEPPGLPTTYLHKALGLSKRRFERLKASTQNYRFISVKPQVAILGPAKDLYAHRKHLKGWSPYVKGKFTVVSGPSKIKVKV